MPEVVCAICHFKTDEEMESELKRGKFEEIPREEVDPTIRRICERSGRVGDEKVDQASLVRALRKGKGYIDETIFGKSTDQSGYRNYVGLNRKDRVLVVVNPEWVKRRKERYEAHPIPDNPYQRDSFVEMLIFEIAEKWSGTARDDPMGVSYAQIVNHVADYSNIERVEATKFVNKVLPTMKILERTEGDHYRIKPHLFKAMQEKYPWQLPS